MPASDSVAPGPGYLEYLGQGYIPMLQAAKEAGHILDYGVLTAVTGNAGDGSVMIWWATDCSDPPRRRMGAGRRRGNDEEQR